MSPRVPDGGFYAEKVDRQQVVDAVLALGLVPNHTLELHITASAIEVTEVSIDEETGKRRIGHDGNPLKTTRWIGVRQ